MSGSIGQSFDRIDVRSKVTGEAKYTSDLTYPDQLHMKVLFAERPHARVLSIDTSRAEAVDGVVAVLTAKDVPVNEYGYIQPDQPVLCGPDSNNPYGDRVRFVGDQVAVVIAETEEAADRGRKAIKVEYEDLPVVSTLEEALKPDAFVLHPPLESNVMSTHRIITGDVDKAFAEADVIVEGEYRTPAQEHAYLEPEAGVSFYDEEGRITLIVAGQWAHKDRVAVAHALDLPEDQIRVIYPYIGGAFGGREDNSVQIILALAAYKLKERGIERPVKIRWTREESIKGHGKRHPFIIRAKWGARKDGTVIAAQSELISDGGAYACTTAIVSKVAILNVTGPYDVPNVKINCTDVYTNNVPRAAFRGFGGPQGAYAAEAQMNKLAEALGMDPVEIRFRNLIKEGSLQVVGAPWPPGVTAREVAEACAEASGWKKADGIWGREKKSDTTGKSSIKRGMGFACSHKNIGFSHGCPETAAMTLELHGDSEIEKAVLRHTSSEVGQGTHTALGQMLADALEIPFEKVQMMGPDTSRSGDTGSVSASRMTFMAGNAIRETADLALKKWAESKERPVILEHVHQALPTTADDPETGHCDPMLAYAYTAEAVEVDVDTVTGQVTISNLICATDVGRAINPLQVDAQVEGALVQAAGYALLENFVEQDGYVKTPDFASYLIPTVLDIPKKNQNIILEIPDPRGPWGASGVGEMPFLAMAPAVAAAVHDATGVWIDKFPLTPEVVLDALEDAGE